jgi:hypothetical protein
MTANESSNFQRITLVHQIMLVDGFTLPTRLPLAIAENAHTLRNLYPQARYHMWDGHSLRDLIASHFEPDVREAFDTLAPYSFKADLARFCILYLYGGLYVDLGMRCLNPLRPPVGIGLASFRDYDLLSPSWVSVAGGITWAAPKRQEFRFAIDYVLENCRARYYGENPLYPTGPVLFGRALISAMAGRRQGPDADDQWIGVSRPLTPGRLQENVAYVAPDHTLIAMRTKRIGGDLAHLGLLGSNNYNTYWRMKKVYGERESVWTFDDPSIRITSRGARTGTGIAAVSEEPGHLTYGPYVELEPGRYRLMVTLGGDIVLPRMVLDVAHGGGEQLTSLTMEAGPRPSPLELELMFETKQRLLDVEFRTEILGRLNGQIIGYRLETLE